MRPPPPGWPPGLPPPEHPEFLARARGWLFDCCPPDYRAYDVLSRHPVVLAAVAGWYAEAAEGAARRGLGDVRARLRGVVEPAVVDAAVGALERELVRAQALVRQVQAVAAAVRARGTSHPPE